MLEIRKSKKSQTGNKIAQESFCARNVTQNCTEATRMQKSVPNLEKFRKCKNAT